MSSVAQQQSSQQVGARNVTLALHSVHAVSVEKKHSIYSTSERFELWYGLSRLIINASILWETAIYIIFLINDNSNITKVYWKWGWLTNCCHSPDNIITSRTILKQFSLIDYFTADYYTNPVGIVKNWSNLTSFEQITRQKGSTSINYSHFVGGIPLGSHPRSCHLFFLKPNQSTRTA